METVLEILREIPKEIVCETSAAIFRKSVLGKQENQPAVASLRVALTKYNMDSHHPAAADFVEGWLVNKSIRRELVSI
ncbi:hypothetical protein [Neobacillus muris]|uniref:hypothetical protein n=1 Tax=Neobacillus muris TaxID=2941334 RepID=UPI00203CCCD0|nr:hypothetical protein [Neobacillus muris]